MASPFERLPFVSTDWLAARLEDPALVVIDGSWHLPPTGRSGRAEFDTAHIPGAQFFDLDALSDQGSALPHMLPPAAFFASAASAMGVSNDSTIVVYDQLGLFSAPRIAWMFVIFGARNVHILEGGLPRWQAEGRPVSAEARAPRAGHFVARQEADIIAGIDVIAKRLQDGTVQIVDARPASRFRGEAPEPRPGVRAGHMPGSLNLPFDTVAANGALKSPDDIRRAMAAAGIDPARPIICSCGSGVSASIIALALNSVGTEVQAIYDGSWAEWGARHDLPIKTGPE